MSDRLPDPPDSLPDLRAGDAVVLPAGTRLYRITNRLGPYAAHPDQLRSWGPAPVARFDHHDPPARDHVDTHGVTAATGYFAIDPPTPVGPRLGELLAADSPIVTAAAEAFQATRTITCSDRHGLAILATTSELDVLDLSSSWPTRAGAGGHLATGPHATTRAWARDIHRTHPGLVGLTWTSSVHPPGRAVVLTERASDQHGVVAARLLFDRPLGDAVTSRLMAAAADVLGYATV